MRQQNHNQLGNTLLSIADPLSEATGGDDFRELAFTP